MADDPVTNAAKELFGFSYLFPYQRLVIANILEAAAAAGIDIHWPTDGHLAENSSDCASDGSDRESLGRQIVILPTGAGKSLCFQLPAMLMEGPTLVIYPILGLMADQERRLAEKGFSPVTLRGGQSKEERDEIWRKLCAGESKFIIANPEVLLTPPVLSRLKEISIIHIVIDEAHCVCEWGESFRPSYLEIRKIIESAASPLVTAFTATAGTAVLDKIEEYIFGGPVCRVIGNPDRKNISYAAKGCILRNLARRGTENLALYLRIETAERALPWHKEIRFYHAGLSREEKKETEAWFLYNKDAVLVATCAFGLGIDKADVRTVIHRDCPPSVEAYLQESGRAGRDGELSKALLLWGPDDDRSLSRAKTEADKKRISSLLAYARDTGKCRREALLDLLDYDGERDSPGSSCCDVCDGLSNTRLREEHSLLDFFRRNKRCYSPSEAAKVLASSENVRWSEEEAGEAIEYLIKAGKIERANNLLWKNKLTFSL
jgi:ATP-dependent DNA helicase RecQ